MAKEFKFVDVNKSLLPKTKGRNQDGFRFYDIDGKNKALSVLMLILHCFNKAPLMTRFGL